MKTLILSMLLIAGSVSAKYVSLPTVNGAIDNQTDLVTENLKLTLILYRVKPNPPPFGLGHGAPELVVQKKYSFSVDKNGAFSLPKSGFWNGKRRYVGLKIENTKGEKIRVHTRMPEDGIYFSAWVPLLMKLSDWSYTITTREYAQYYQNIEIYYNVDGNIVAKSQGIPNDSGAWEGNIDYLQKAE